MAVFYDGRAKKRIAQDACQVLKMMRITNLQRLWRVEIRIFFENTWKNKVGFSSRSGMPLP